MENSQGWLFMPLDLAHFRLTLDEAVRGRFHSRDFLLQLY